MPRFSQESREQLATCNKAIQLVFEQVIRHYDCRVIEGHRTPERQAELFASGASKVRQGKHNANPSNAIDVAPYPIIWPDKELRPKEYVKDMMRFANFAGHVEGIARAMGINIRWGGDWDRDHDLTDNKFDDLVHFEIMEV